jgi:hypothetical protein
MRPKNEPGSDSVPKTNFLNDVLYAIQALVLTGHLIVRTKKRIKGIVSRD